MLSRILRLVADVNVMDTRVAVLPISELITCQLNSGHFCNNQCLRERERIILSEPFLNLLSFPEPNLIADITSSHAKQNPGIVCFPLFHALLFIRISECDWSQIQYCV